MTHGRVTASYATDGDQSPEGLLAWVMTHAVKGQGHTVGPT